MDSIIESSHKDTEASIQHLLHIDACCLIVFKVIGIRPMAPVLNTGPPEGI